MPAFLPIGQPPPLPTASSATSRSIPSLDGLRAISIALVIVSHGGLLWVPASGPLRDALGWMGAFGVSVFFVISGFLITHLLVREKEATGMVRLRAFYFRRAFRILPAYWTFIAAAVVMSRFRLVDVGARPLVAALTFTWNYSSWATGWTLAHTWSLSVEEQFYLLWPWIVMLLDRRRARQVTLALILLAPAIRVITYFALPSLRGRTGMMLHTRIDTLMFGCWLALSIERWREPAAFSRCLRPAGLIAAALAIPLCGALTVRLHGRFELPVGFTVEAAAATVLLTWVVLRPTTPVARVLNTRVMKHIGALSYSLYLWQQPIMRPDGALMRRSVAVALLALMVVSQLSYAVVERPLLRLRERLSARGERSLTRD